MEFNFLRYNLNKIDHLGADYDTCSIMHYGEYAFSKVKRTKFNWETRKPSAKNLFNLTFDEQSDPHLALL